MSEKFRLDRKIVFQNTFFTKCINVIIDSIGPLIILRSIHKNLLAQQAQDLLEKLAEILLYNFHREHILLKLKTKKLLRKIRSKNLSAGVYNNHTVCQVLCTCLQCKHCCTRAIRAYCI